MQNAEKISIRDIPGGAVVCVKVVPGSSRDKVVGVLGDAIKIATSAAPEKGRANQAVAKTLAKALSLDARSVTISAGQTNPRKEFTIANQTATSLRSKFQKIL